MDAPNISQQITFFHSSDLHATKQFYSEILTLPLVRDQSTCLIFGVTNSAFLGFCTHIEPVAAGRKVILTLVTEDVDQWYQRLMSTGVEVSGPPQSNPKYQIYHFFLKDPDGYWIEIQKFDHPL
jgi:predicted enzyme related to lactoylglutathione lyase